MRSRAWLWIGVAVPVVVLLAWVATGGAHRVATYPVVEFRVPLNFRGAVCFVEAPAGAELGASSPTRVTVPRHGIVCVRSLNFLIRAHREEWQLEDGSSIPNVSVAEAHSGSARRYVAVGLGSSVRDGVGIICYAVTMSDDVSEVARDMKEGRLHARTAAYAREHCR